MINPKIKIFIGTDTDQLETEINSFLESKVIVDIKSVISSNCASTDQYTYTVIYCE